MTAAVDGVRCSLSRRWFVAFVCVLMVGGLSAPAALYAQDPDDDAEVAIPRQQAVDQAIVAALKYLATQQQPNGSWMINSFGESTAATSLAIMSFLSAGHIPGEGPYGKQIERGIDWVLAHQHPQGMLVHKSSHGPLYSHGISTLMLAEVQGMVNRRQAEPVRRGLERAIRLILEAQAVPKDDQHAGGWRYQSDSRDSDLSVTGWQLLALRAAKNNGCDVPAESIDDAVAYVKKCSLPADRGFGFAYQPGGGATATRTGTGILALEICGEHHTPEALGGADYLLRHPLQYSEHYFFYGVYYCSVGLFQVGGEHWEAQKANYMDILLRNQSPDGSWVAKHGSERSSGSIYSTSMSVLALAVEYQFLPIYQR